MGSGKYVVIATSSQGYFILKRALRVSKPKEHNRARLSHILKFSRAVQVQGKITR